MNSITSLKSYTISLYPILRTLQLNNNLIPSILIYTQN